MNIEQQTFTAEQMVEFAKIATVGQYGEYKGCRTAAEKLARYVELNEPQSERRIKTEIIRPLGSPHYLALIQWNYGASDDLKRRAYVTYISNHWDHLHPFNLAELRAAVMRFAAEHGLTVKIEQTTDHRFTHWLHGRDHSTATVDDEGRIYENGVFISPVDELR